MFTSAPFKVLPGCTASLPTPPQMLTVGTEIRAVTQKRVEVIALIKGSFLVAKAHKKKESQLKGEPFCSYL